MQKRTSQMKVSEMNSAELDRELGRLLKVRGTASVNKRINEIAGMLMSAGPAGFAPDTKCEVVK